MDSPLQIPVDMPNQDGLVFTAGSTFSLRYPVWFFTAVGIVFRMGGDLFVAAREPFGIAENIQESVVPQDMV